MISLVHQNGNLWNIHWLGAEIIHVLCEQFNQASIIGLIRRCAEGEERKTQSIHCQMPFDAISRFVEAESFGVYAGITRIFDGLGVEQD